jgi:hypothetical protein
MLAAPLVPSPASPLSSEEEAILQSIATCGDRKAVVYSSTTLKYVGTITRYDVRCLLEERQRRKPRGQLNDEVCRLNGL